MMEVIGIAATSITLLILVSVFYEFGYSRGFADGYKRGFNIASQHAVKVYRERGAEDETYIEK